MTQKMQNFLINFQKNIKYFFPSIDCIMKSLPHPRILCFLHFRLPAIFQDGVAALGIREWSIDRSNQGALGWPLGGVMKGSPKFWLSAQIEWSLNSLPVLEALAMLEAEGVKDKIYSSSGTPSPCPDSLIPAVVCSALSRTLPLSDPGPRMEIGFSDIYQ